MPDIFVKYGADGVAIDITLNTLASAAARQSAPVDNSINLFRDVLVMLRAKNHASNAPTGDKAIYVYAYGTVDVNLPLYPDAVTGTNAAITLDSPTHLKPLGSLAFTAAAQTKNGGPWSLGSLFGGRVPKKWGIVVQNATGQSLDVSEANFVKEYQGVVDTVS